VLGMIPRRRGVVKVNLICFGVDTAGLQFNCRCALSFGGNMDISPLVLFKKVARLINRDSDYLFS